MKILKPGKVEMRKFVCPRCGCIFAVSRGENVIRQGSRYPDTAVIACPEQGCNGGIVVWSDGEPYEEPTQSDLERMASLVYDAPQTHANSWSEAAKMIAQYLIDHGVTFREG